MLLQSFFFPSRNLSNLGNISEGHHLSPLMLGPGDSGQQHNIAIISYFFLQIFGGHFGVPVILLTLVFKKEIRRHPLLINFLVTWVLYSTAFCLLLYVGKQFGPEPPRGLCLSQASLIYGAAIMTSTAGLSFIWFGMNALNSKQSGFSVCLFVKIWFGMNALNSKQSGFSGRKWRDYLLIAVPYVLFVLFTIVMAVVGSAYPQRVTRHTHVFYCTIDLQVVDLVPGCSGLVLVFVLVLEVLIGVKLYRMYKAFASMKANSTPQMYLVVRVVIFTVYSILSILACIGFWSQKGDAAPYIIQASLPTAAFVIFGTQSDLLRVWGISGLWSRLSRKGKETAVQKSNPVPPVQRSAEELQARSVMT